MADRRISALPVISTISDADILPLSQGVSGPDTGTTGQVTRGLLLTTTATGSTTPRTLTARVSDFVNVKDYGAVLDGTTSDQAALTAAFVAVPALGRIIVPYGNINLASFAPTSKQVLWQMSGNYTGSGTAELTAIGNNVLESFLATGGKYFARGSTQSMSPLGGVLRVDMTVNHAGGTAGGLSAMEVNIGSTAASTPGQELIAASFRGTSNRTGTTSRTVTGIAASARKTAGNTQPFGGNIYAEDATYDPGVNNGSSGDNGSAVGLEVDIKANGLDDGLLADGYNNNPAVSQPGANRIGLDIKTGRYDRNDLNNMVISNLVNLGPVDTDTSWIYVKNLIASRMQILFAGLNFRQSSFGASANGVLFQVGGNSTLAWTADDLLTTPTNYATIKGTGSAGNLGLQFTPIGTGTNQLDVSATSPRFNVGTGGPAVLSGSGVPAATEPKGSIYLRTGGGVGTTFYVSQGGGTWNAVAGV